MKPLDVQRWVIPGTLGTAISVIALTAIFLAVRIETPPKSAAHAEPTSLPVIKLAGGLDQDEERRQLTDLEPLFLPTKFNASVLPLPVQVRKEPGSMSFTFPPFFTIGESTGGLVLPPLVEAPVGPAEGLRVGQPPNPYAELRRTDRPSPTLERRLAHIEVRAAGTGETVFSESFPAPADSTLISIDWSPMEFVVAVDKAGLVGAPAVTKPTTSEEVQEFFRRFVVHQLHLGARLTPGFYTVHVGP